MTKTNMSTRGRAVRVAAAAGAAVGQERGRCSARVTETRSNEAAPATAVRSSPRRSKKSAAAGGPQGTPLPTAVSRRTTAKSSSSGGGGKRAATPGATAATTIPAVAVRASLQKARNNKSGSGTGSGSGGGDTDNTAGGAADGDAAMKMLATLLSPVAAARQDTRPPDAQHDQAPGTPISSRGAQESSASGRDSGEGHDLDPCPLEAMFLALEQVLALFRRRRQATLLKQIKPAVEGMCGRSFTRQHLARIAFVQPDAYKLSSRTDARPTRGGYRLKDIFIETGPSPPPADEACLDDDTQGARRDRVGKAPAAGKGAVAGADRDGRNGGDTGGHSIAGGEALSARRREIFLRLLASAKARHCKCGGSRGIAGGPSAPRDECSCLPQAPLPDTRPLRADGIGGGSRAAPDAGGAVESPSTSQGLERSPGDGRSGGGGGGNLLPGTFRGGCVASGMGGGRVDYDEEGSDAPKNVEALRERLRQKDALSAKERNKTEEEKEADRRRKGNLPAMADAVRSYFAHAGRTTCSLDVLIEALSSSSKHALSHKEARDRVRMLASIVPEWCTIIAPRAPSAGGGGGIDGGLVARPMKGKDVVRVNTRIRFDEVRQMIAFMSGGGASQ
ncbi:conserved unknown protein [Ectocarpus siliculosus]|uniref:CDT1 Geminin-binding domain-containing protein n=1 Tax=Ectocarpus siliculosus TaxID=2880 RepID=D8LEW8_ECTSI|nr:conserved unknown protein [Ectocarpus siliculosus]|eukprot:CBN79788.1 conserved unknown protein [Ectocarpus siliculosus]